MAYTWGDLRQFIYDENAGQADTEAQRRAIRVTNAALRAASAKFAWEFFLTYGTVFTVGPESSGTVTVAQGTGAVVLSGGSWPSGTGDAGIGRRRILIAGSDFAFELASATSSTASMVSGQKWPFASAAGATYQLWRDNYAGPSDFRAGARIVPDNGIYLAYSTYQEFMEYLRDVHPLPGTPSQWTYHNGRILLAPPPGEIGVYPFAYLRWPAAVSASTTASTAVDFPDYPALLEAACRYYLAKEVKRDLQVPLFDYKKELEDARCADNSLIAPQMVGGGVYKKVIRTGADA